MTKKLAKKAFMGLTMKEAHAGATRLGYFEDPIAEGLKKAGVKKRP
jgi:hypothetical protein